MKMKQTKVERVPAPELRYGGRKPAHWVLAHNPVQALHPDQKHGENGFRRFWVDPKDRRWVICNERDLKF